MLGFPDETPEEMVETINFACELKELGMGECSFFPVSVYAGTELANQVNRDSCVSKVYRPVKSDFDDDQRLHADHFDAELVGKCIALNRPVLMHDSAALSSHLTVGRMGDQDEFLTSGSLIKTHHGCHVWRDQPNEVAVTAFEIEFDTSYRLVFCGDMVRLLP